MRNSLRRPRQLQKLHSATPEAGRMRPVFLTMIYAQLWALRQLQPWLLRRHLSPVVKPIAGSHHSPRDETHNATAPLRAGLLPQTRLVRPRRDVRFRDSSLRAQRGAAREDRKSVV